MLVAAATSNRIVSGASHDVPMMVPRHCPTSLKITLATGAPFRAPERITQSFSCSELIVVTLTWPVNRPLIRIHPARLLDDICPRISTAETASICGTESHDWAFCRSLTLVSSMALTTKWAPMIRRSGDTIRSSPLMGRRSSCGRNDRYMSIA